VTISSNLYPKAADFNHMDLDVCFPETIITETPTIEVDFSKSDNAAVLDTLTRRGLLPILDAVCETHNVSRDEVLGRSRLRSLVNARQDLWWRVRHHPNAYSYHEMGKFFSRHHSSIVSGIRRHERVLRKKELLASLAASRGQSDLGGAAAPVAMGPSPLLSAH